MRAGPALLCAGLAAFIAGCGAITAAGNITAAAVSPLVALASGEGAEVPRKPFPVYGNWCGPGVPPPENGDTAETLPPLDPLDTACMKHDMCYRAAGGKPACACNDDLLWRVKYIQHHDPEMQAQAGPTMTMILAWVTSAPCSEPGTDPATPSR